jgi:hypothetical protein
MADTSSLLQQLASRARYFHQSTGITQSQLASALKMADGNYSAFLAGKKGLGAEAVCQLLKFTNMSKQQAIAQFSRPVRSSRIMELQECGKALHFSNDGWTAREGGTDDPNNSTDITNTRKAATATSIADLVALLGALDGVTRKSVIDAIVKAYPNPNATTPNNGQRFSR